MKAMVSRNIVVLVGLMVFLVTGQNLGHGFTWCFGENGPAVLEYAAGRSCAPGAQQKGPVCHEEERPDFQAQADPCGACLDVPTTPDATSIRIQHHRVLPVPAAGIQETLSLTCDLFPAASSHARLQPHTSKTILAHRTVVLLN